MNVYSIGRMTMGGSISYPFISQSNAPIEKIDATTRLTSQISTCDDMAK